MVEDICSQGAVELLEDSGLHGVDLPWVLTLDAVQRFLGADIAEDLYKARVKVIALQTSLMTAEELAVLLTSGA